RLLAQPIGREENAVARAEEAGRRDERFLQCHLLRIDRDAAREERRQAAIENDRVDERLPGGGIGNARQVEMIERRGDVDATRKRRELLRIRRDVARRDETPYGKRRPILENKVVRRAEKAMLPVGVDM